MYDPWWLCVVLVILLFAVNAWLIIRVLKPLRRLAQQANRVTEGDFSALEAPCGGIPEIEALRRSLFAMLGHVRRAQEQGHRYVGVLTSGQEKERMRLARELHDETVQALIGIAQGVELASTWMEKRPREGVEKLKEVRLHAVDTVNTLRRLIADLRPPALEELGLVTALKMLANQSDTLETEISVIGFERRLNEAQELTLFRSVQETIRNAQKHSGATHIQVNVGYFPKQVSLTVVDDGKGFPVPEYIDHFARNGHFGLVGIEERVHNIGGTLKIETQLDKGTRVTVELPCKEENQPMGEVRDPVCSVVIKPHQAYSSLLYEGEQYYFCCPVCQGAFQQNPTIYIKNRPQA